VSGLATFHHEDTFPFFIPSTVRTLSEPQHTPHCLVEQVLPLP